MWVKIIIECILAYFSVVLGTQFKNCIQYSNLVKRMFGDYTRLKKMYDSLGEVNVIKDSMKLDTKTPYSVTIDLWLSAGVSSNKKIQYICLSFIICILVGSYFMGVVFVLINLALIALFLFFTSPSVSTSMIEDVRMVMAIVYKWHKTNPDQCKDFCNNEQPLALKNIYKVLTGIS